jgi:hypothetical protein
MIRVKSKVLLVVRVVFLVFLVVGPGLVSVAADQFQRFSWRGPIGEAKALKVENAFGDVRLRFGGDAGQVEVAAVMQQLRKDGVHLETRTEDIDGVLVISVGWTTKPGMTIPMRPEGDLSRVDLAVLVPSGSLINVETVHGLVESRGVHGDAHFVTETGDIRIHRHFGTVSASTKSGGIEAVLLTGETGEDQSFESLTGSIEIWVGADAKLDVTMKTSEAITTDFSVKIEYRDDEEPGKIARAVIGGGGPGLLLASRRGAVALRRVAAVRDSRAP